MYEGAATFFFPRYVSGRRVVRYCLIVSDVNKSTNSNDGPVGPSYDVRTSHGCLKTSGTDVSFGPPRMEAYVPVSPSPVSSCLGSGRWGCVRLTPLPRKKRLPRNEQLQVKQCTGQRQMRDLASVASALLVKHACPIECRLMRTLPGFLRSLSTLGTKAMVAGWRERESRVSRLSIFRILFSSLHPAHSSFRCS